jgi:DnaJ family protein C protein 9
MYLLFFPPVCRRKVYDRTGSLDDTEQLSGEQFDSLYNFYRSMYVPVTEQDIDDFGATFKGGAEERADVLKHYEEFKGDMPNVFTCVMLSDPKQDSHRFMDLINSAIDSGEVTRYKKYTTWAAAVAKKKRPALEVPGASKAKGGGQAKKKGARETAGQALAAMMQQRHPKPQGHTFDSLLSTLASKYGVNEQVFPSEPTEEEFEAAQQRLRANTSSGGRGSENKKRQSGSDGGGNKQEKKKRK